MIIAKLAGIASISVNGDEIKILNDTPELIQGPLSNAIEIATKTVRTSPSIADPDMELVKEISKISGLKPIKIIKADEPYFNGTEIY
jgi:hypothetical protein